MARTESWTREVAQLLALVRARRQYYHDMLNLLPVAAVMLASDGSVGFANSAFCRQFGIREEDIQPRTVSQILPSMALSRRILAARLSGIPQRPFPFEISGATVHISIVPLVNWRHSVEIDTLLLIQNPCEIEQARTATHTIDAALTLHDELADDQIPAILWHADSKDLTFCSVRGATQELLGFPIDHWKKTPNFFSERIHPEDRVATLALYRAAIDRRGDASAEFRGLATTGVVWLRETIRVEGSVIAGVITSVGARKNIEEQRIRDERIRALRNLASNSSESLSGAATPLSDQGRTMLMAGSPADGLEQTASGVSQICRVNRELAGFTSRQPSPPGVVNVPRLLKQMRDRIAAANTRVSVEVNADDSVLAFADESQLEEVLVAVTASICRDALEGSRLTITCDLQTVTERIPRATLAPGNYARMAVHHHGRGLEFELQEPLFESLLTSLPSKRGTLPGLSRAYTLVREWGGDIAFLNEPNTAAFLVYLPHCPSVELEQDPILTGLNDPEGEAASYQDLIDLLLAEIALPHPNPDLGEPFRQEPFDIDVRLSEGPLR